MDKTELERVISEIQACYDAGLEHLELGRPYGSEGTVAEKNLRRTKKAFANPKSGYTQEDLQTLFDAFRKTGWAMPLSSVLRLNSVKDKKKRKQMQTVAIRERWSVANLNKKIRDLYGNRKPTAGRGKRIASLVDAKDELLGMVDQWQRLVLELDRASSAAPIRVAFPAALRLRVTNVNDTIVKLKAFLDRPTKS